MQPHCNNYEDPNHKSLACHVPKKHLHCIACDKQKHVEIVCFMKHLERRYKKANNSVGNSRPSTLAQTPAPAPPGHGTSTTVQRQQQQKATINALKAKLAATLDLVA